MPLINGGANILCYTDEDKPNIRIGVPCNYIKVYFIVFKLPGYINLLCFNIVVIIKYQLSTLWIISYYNHGTQQCKHVPEKWYLVRCSSTGDGNLKVC